MADFKNPKNIINIIEDRIEDASPSSFMEIEGSEEDKILAKSEYLTREELVKRRLRYNKQLKQCYKDYYWALMEDLKVQYRKYYWMYGKSPYKEDDEIEEATNGCGIRDDHDNITSNGTAVTNGNGGNGLKLGFDKCAAAQCKLKAMALARFCHAHIMSDTKQTLYKRCTHVIKSAPTGPLTCGKTILRSAVPALCATHLQNAKNQVARALKKAGLNNVSSSSKPSPKLQIILAEYARHIQTRRRTSYKGIVDKLHNKEDDAKDQIKEEDAS